MSILNSNQDSIQFPTLYVAVYLNSLKNKNALYYHDCILEWKSDFDEIQVPIYIISKDTCQTIFEIEREYKYPFIYGVDPSLDIFKKRNLLKSKKVFGKEYLTIYSCIELVYNGKAIYRTQRFTKNTLCELYFSATDIKYKNFKKKFRKSVDTSKKLC